MIIEYWKDTNTETEPFKRTLLSSDDLEHKSFTRVEGVMVSLPVKEIIKNWLKQHPTGAVALTNDVE